MKKEKHQFSRHMRGKDYILFSSRKVASERVAGPQKRGGEESYLAKAEFIKKGKKSLPGSSRRESISILRQKIKTEKEGGGKEPLLV